MFTTILVPLNGTRQGAKALAYACDLALTHKSELVLL